MQFPALDDTIVAVASGWRASPIGIVRLSGTEAFEIVRSVGPPCPTPNADTFVGTPFFANVNLYVNDTQTLPATAFCFHAPHSYTGQDAVELHTIGCLPALRELTARLIAAGARRALPGEFTARAYLNGKLDGRQVDGVLTLIYASNADAARQAARLVGGHSTRALSATTDQLLGLIARIEAGIDFVDEEDVRFVTAAQARTEIDQVMMQLSAATPGRFDQRRAKPHVALAGLPNAGKSSLFNALLGTQRTIVSPRIGTTRDVISAHLDCRGIEIVLQDSAGLGASSDEIELAAHIAAESAADHADLVLWVHDGAMPWSRDERTACERIPFDRRVLVVSKVDTPAALPASTLTFRATLLTSVMNHTGLTDVENCVAGVLATAGGATAAADAGSECRRALEALRRAKSVIGAADAMISQPELASVELHAACELLSGSGGERVSELVLGRIFTQYCVGK